MKPFILLVGGIYGAGKSTIGRNVSEMYPPSTVTVIDIDTVRTQEDVYPPESADRWREMIPTIDRAIAAGTETIVVIGTFYIRESRDAYIQYFQDSADIVGIMVMPSLRETLPEVKLRRTEHGVNAVTYKPIHKRFIREMTTQENDDMLLPNNLETVPLGYQRIFKRHELGVINSSPSWVTYFHHLVPHDISSIIDRRITTPLNVQALLDLSLSYREVPNYGRKEVA